MSGAVKITRLDKSSLDLRRAAKVEKNALVVRRLLALALVLEGSDRKSSAEACGMDRQTLRDWVHRYNADGIAGLAERRHSNHKSPLTPELERAFASLVEQGPDPAVHGVVRWRRCDLRDELKRQYGIEAAERTVGGWLAKLAFRRLSVRPQHPEADEQAQEAFKKTSPKSWHRRCPTRRAANLSKSGSRTKPGSASKAP